MRNQEIRKYASLQILRAAAAWTVVYHHYMQLYFGLESKTLIGGFFSRYGDLGVDIFFVLSGFVMHFAATRTNKGAGPFIIDRIFRIAPVYWFYSLILVACMLFLPKEFSFTDYNLRSLVSSLLFIPNWNPAGLGLYPVLTVGWTLNFEMFFYASLALCMAMTASHFLKLLSLVFLLLPVVYPSTMFYSGIASSFMLYEFLAGLCLAQLWTSRPGDRFLARYHRIAVVFAVIAVVASARILMVSHIKFPIAVSVVLLALLGERYLSAKSTWVKGLVRLGDESYSTYLVHVIVIGIALHFTGKNIAGPDELITIFTISVAIWAASRISYRLVERNMRLDNMRRHIIGRLFGRPTAAPTPASPATPSMPVFPPQTAGFGEPAEMQVPEAVPRNATDEQPRGVGIE